MGVSNRRPRQGLLQLSCTTPTARMRLPISQQRLMCCGGELEVLDKPASSLSTMVFEFLEDGDRWLSTSSSSSEEGGRNEAWLEQNDEHEEENGSVEEDTSFWENQQRLLRASLIRTTPLESSIRNIIKEALAELHKTGKVCGCGKPMVEGCRNCLMRELSVRLRNAGYNSAFCRSKWRSSPDIPSGEHTFLDVIDNSSSRKGEIRVIIEPNFRAEFEMAKAGEEYNQLVRWLPEVFVGKAERLSSVIKILCLAAKKCMREKKMHLGPWRKRRYMQAKWLGSCERTTTSMTDLPMESSRRLAKPKTSMLTVDLLETRPNMHRTTVAVV